MLNLLKSVAVQDQTVATNIATLDNIMSGVDGSATFGYTLEDTAVQVNDNQKQQFLHTHTFDIRVLQGSATTVGILDAVVANNRQVKITGISPDGFFIWDDPTYLVRGEQFDQVIADQILATKSAPAGYQGVAGSVKLPVYAGDNALALYDILGGSSTVLNGLTAGTGVTASQASGEQTLTRASSTGTGVTSASIFFPFVGVQITASMDVVTDVAGTHSFGVRFLDSSGATLSTSTATVSGTGLQTHTATSPASTTYIQFVALVGNTASDQFSFRKPMLALGGRTTFSI